MRSQRGARGRFSSLYGTTTLRLGDDFPVPPGAPRYERLVFDCDGQLIVALNEWYRLMHGVGAARTRETYLAVLRPWCGFLGKHGYAWNARPEAVREYTRLFLVEAGCALQRGRVDGWFVQATSRSPMSNSGLHLLIAALRSFYSVMQRGVFDDHRDQRFHLLYAYDNPMYSPILLAWRAEHRKWIRNAGAPDHAGIRSESRADSERQPVGFFQVKRQPLEPPVARDAEPTRLAILAGVRSMVAHASRTSRMTTRSSSRTADDNSATRASASCSIACSARRSAISDRVRTGNRQCRSRCPPSRRTPSAICIPRSGSRRCANCSPHQPNASVRSRHSLMTWAGAAPRCSRRTTTRSPGPS